MSTSPRFARPAVLAPALALGLACSGAGADPSRSAWLQEQLRRDNAAWLSRDPELVAVKLDRMAADPYDFMRGTAGIYYNDLQRVDLDEDPLAPLFGFEALAMLFGDAHPENLGTGWPGAAEAGAAPPVPGALAVEFFDPDAITFGPVGFELKRAAVGLGALGLGGGCGAPCRRRAAAALGRGWAAGLSGATWGDGAAGPSALVLGLQDDAAVAAATLELRLEDVALEALAVEALPVEAGAPAEGWRLRRAPLDEAGRGARGLEAEELAQVRRLAPAIERRFGLRLVDAVRRFGSGVSSIPALRYLLLLDRGGGTVEELVVLDLRELVDPPVLPVGGPLIAGVFEDGADRVERGAQSLWADPEADPFLMGLMDGDQAFRLRGWRGAFDALDHVKITEALLDGGLTELDLEALAFDEGLLLGGAHARAPGPDGAPRQASLADALRSAGGAEGLARRLSLGVEDDLDRLEGDHALLRALIEREGPLAGIDAPGGLGDPTMVY
jgi:hypothetical protein